MKGPLSRIFAAIIFGAATAAGLSGRAAAGDLVSGPMLGYRAHREVAIWLETRDAAEVEIRYQISGNQASAKTMTKSNPAPSPAGVQPMTFVLPMLKMGAGYDYKIVVDGRELSFPWPLRFATTDQWEWRRDPPEFSFIFGSCAYINEPEFDRPGEPYGKTLATIESMGRSGADFMIWGGDNVYLREADFSSVSGIHHRYSHDRAIPEMQRLLASMHHYATWDDHDYGPNNSNRSFEFKETTLDAFRTYWANPTYGEADNPGVYTKFTWGDGFFILLDNHYYRGDSNPNQHLDPSKTQWGPRQMDWLKQSLLHAKELKLYPFKFIVNGTQFLSNGLTGGEGHDQYLREREELLEFIRDSDIGGVVFLTGDVHFTGLYRRQLGDTQWVYELTSSPFTSGAFENIADTAKGRDPQIVEDTLVDTQNYCIVKVVGPRQERELRITCIDKEDSLRWEKTVPLTEL